MKTQSHEATVRLQYDDGSFESEPYVSLIKLVEEKMPGRMAEFSYWFGVAEIAMEYKAYLSAMQKGDAFDFGLFIKLNDGRLGLARVLNAQLSENMEEQYSIVHVSFFGVDQLSVPRQSLS